MTIKLSKSRFAAGCQCLKRLYLQAHEPELAAEPEAAAEAIIEQGREVGMLARQLFPGGVEVRAEGGLEQAIRATRELTANREVPAIFEGTFEHGGVLVRVDILNRRRDGRWRLIEVKSTTDVKDHHVGDVAIQHRVVCRSGIRLDCLLTDLALCFTFVDSLWLELEMGDWDAAQWLLAETEKGYATITRLVR